MRDNFGHPAAGPVFELNPFQWWKAAAGQKYYRALPATLAQRLKEAAWPGWIPPTIGYLYYLKLQAALQEAEANKPVPPRESRPRK